MARFGDVHAFGYDSAESEPIWMKSGALWVHCRGLALADFGRDLHSSDSWRARRNLVFLSRKQRTISLISRQPHFTKFTHNTSIGVVMKTFGTELWKFYCKRSFFQKNAQIFKNRWFVYRMVVTMVISWKVVLRAAPCVTAPFHDITSGSSTSSLGTT